MNETYYKMPKLCYIQEKPYDSKDEYRQFYKYLKKNCLDNEESIKKNKLKYFDRSTKKIINLIEKNSENNDMYKHIMFSQIDSKNKEEFKNLILNLEQQYKYLISLDEDKEDYNYFKRLMSWYRLSIDSLESAVKNLSKKEIDSSNFKLINYYNENGRNIKLILEENKKER